MRILVAFAALLVVSVAARGPAADEGAFVAGIGDLPLMGGLSQDPAQDVVFDKPGGRIVQAVARGSVEPAAVRAFYQSTLPQLGWTPAGTDRWAREGEALALEFPASREPGHRAAGPRGPAVLTVRFLLSPL
jgi:hypothetical protein